MWVSVAVRNVIACIGQRIDNQGQSVDCHDLHERARQDLGASDGSRSPDLALGKDGAPRWA